MKTLSEYIGKSIWFLQPSVLKRIHELRVNDQLIGTMQQIGFFKTIWKVSIHNKYWEIYRPSFWRSSIDIREAGYELPMAIFFRDRFKSKGSVKLPMGYELKIEPHLFKGFCEIKNVAEECVVRIISKTTIKDKAEVLIKRNSELIDKYPWVIMLAYIIAIEQKHHASHAAV